MGVISYVARQFLSNSASSSNTTNQSKYELTNLENERKDPNVSETNADIKNSQKENIRNYAILSNTETPKTHKDSA